MSIFGTHDHTGQPVPLTLVMPMQRYPKQTAWSYSSVQQHNTCPLVIRFRKIDRLPEPKSEHLQRGLDVHERVEKLIKEGVPNMQLGEPLGILFQQLHDTGAMTELKLAFDRDWNVLDDYFDPSVWLRTVLDAVVVDDAHDRIDVWEWKTGKQYEDHKKQARLYALAAMLMYPFSTINVHIRYLDRYPEGHDILNFTPAMRGALKQEFTEFSHDYLNDEIYPARPNRFCRNCHFRASNGGPCAYA